MLKQNGVRLRALDHEKVFERFEKIEDNYHREITELERQAGELEKRG